MAAAESRSLTAPRRLRDGVAVAALAMLALAALAGAAPQSTHAAEDVGHEDYRYTGTSSPNGTKRAESTLWFNDGSWWGNMWDPASADFHIFRLDTAMQTWVDTGTTVDSRSNTHADTLWDGARLYIASHVHSNTPSSGYLTYLYRFSYDPVTRRYLRDPGFPVEINNYRSKAVVLDKDSTGKLWATWMQGTEVYINRTVGG